MRVRVLLLTTLTVACATSSEKTPAKPPADEMMVVAGGKVQIPAGLRQLLEKERFDLPVQRVKLDHVAGTPTVEVTSLRPPQALKSQLAGANEVVAVLDEGAEASCLIASSRLDAAHAIANFYARIQANEAIKQRYPKVVAFGEDAKVPVLTLRVDYLTQKQQYGVVRIAVANIGQRAIACSFDAPGHERTFDTLLGTLIASLLAGQPPAPGRTLFYRVSLNGQLVGLSENVLISGDDGSLSEVEYGSLLFAKHESVFPEDMLVEETADSGGALAYEHKVLRRLGKVVDAFEVNRAPSGEVTLAGVVDGENVDEPLGKVVLSNGPGRRRAIADAIKRGDLQVARLPVLQTRGRIAVVEMTLALRRMDGDVGEFEETRPGDEELQVRTRYARQGDLLSAEFSSKGGALRIEHIPSP